MSAALYGRFLGLSWRVWPSRRSVAPKLQYGSKSRAICTLIARITFCMSESATLPLEQLKTEMITTSPNVRTGPMFLPRREARYYLLGWERRDVQRTRGARGSPTHAGSCTGEGTGTGSVTGCCTGGASQSVRTPALYYSR